LDFWDLTVLIFRRWMVALPLLLVAIGATALVGLTVKPNYTMTSYVQFVPANFAPTDNPVNASLRNPWNQLGLATLGQASIYITQDQRFLDSLKAGKHTDNFTLTMTNPNPIVTVEVVGSTRADARETTELVIKRLRDSAEALQKQSAVKDPDIIPTVRLDQGQNLVPSTGKVKRALAAVAAAGLLITVGGTVAFDALARRRSRKRHESEQAEPLREPSKTGTINGNEAPSSSEVSGKEAAEPPLSLSGAPFGSMERTAMVVKRTAKVVKHQLSPKSTRPPQAATYRSVNAQSEANADDHDASTPATNGDSADVHSDVRVVLQPKWVGGENGGKSD
jgi:hypothetical protein